MKCVPSARNCGQKWLPSVAVVAAVTGPPWAETRDSPPGPVVNTMTSRAPHAAPPLVWTLAATICVSPLDTRIFLRLLAAKKPIHSPSADQNGVFAPSVPGSACSTCVYKERSRSCSLPSPVTLA